MSDLSVSLVFIPERLVFHSVQFGFNTKHRILLPIHRHNNTRHYSASYMDL